MTDPNWLYSTVAQSSAAIVAIMGGFITASLLTRAAEKNDLKHQLADKKTRLEAFKRSHVDPGSGEFRALEGEISHLESRINSFSLPPLLWPGFVTLALVATTSVVCPVFFILVGNFAPFAKWLVFILFFLGLIAIFIYIWFYIRLIKRA